ncbi:MAG: CPBP family glutamic-type intramembrane protease [Kiritimatiellae bacterium]|nr:CPBP family glutamic-type intramembrane protease [Kiritimatiellia bacterium]
MKKAGKIWLVGPYVAIGVGLLIVKNAWVTLFGFHGMMLAALWFHRRQWNIETLWRGGRLLWLPVISLSVLALGYGLTQLAGCFPGYGQHLRRMLSGIGLSGAGMAVFAIYICIMNPVIEEMFWRGLFFEEHKRPVLADLAYGGFHFLVFMPFMFVHHALIAAVSLVVMGYIWRRIACHQKGLTMPLVWHALGDTAIILAIGGILTG